MSLIRKLGYRIKEYIRPKAVVLMYHRIADLESDVWDIAVSPAHFEEQLQLLKKSGKVISLKALAEDLRKGRLKRGSIAITFDDGYVDNFLAAKPLLEKYSLPATFFITSGNLDRQAEFWWDELERLFLFSEVLPQALDISLNGSMHHFKLGNESLLTDNLRRQHQQWQGCEEAPPSQRAEVYMQLWQALRSLPHLQQQQALERLRQWAETPALVRESYRSMSLNQLKAIASSELFDIGIHTLTHPALACHAPAYQQHEIMANKQFLEEATGQSIKLMAYPFGNYKEDTLQIVAQQQLLAALTTEEELVKTNANPYRLGRFQVKNWNGRIFKQHLQQWAKGK